MIRREKAAYWQWDLDRVVYTDQPFVHFALLRDSRALVVEAADGEAEIPNVLLQDGRDIYAWAFDGARVRQECKFRDGMRIPVFPRPKPESYVYEPSAVLTLESLESWVEEQIEQLKVDGGFDYSPLLNKPKINGVELVGDKSFEELGLTPMTNTEVDAICAELGA